MFEEIVSVDCDVTTALGGFNKKTGKPNPTKMEGYYVGSKQVASPKAKSGKCSIYILQTQKGNVGVWGKTDLDRKMVAVAPGCLIRITQSGTVPTPNGDMYKFKVEVDKSNRIDVPTGTEAVAAEATDFCTAEDDAADDSSVFDDDTPIDEVKAPARPLAPSRPAVRPSAEQQAKTMALLSRSKTV